MSIGIISRLMKAQGFGFIKCAGGHEVFFHRSQVQGTAFELLTYGQSTKFKVALGNKGLQAIDVRPITGSPTRKVDNKNPSGKERVPTS